MGQVNLVKLQWYAMADAMPVKKSAVKSSYNIGNFLQNNGKPLYDTTIFFQNTP